MDTSHESLKAALHRDPWFAGLPPRMQDALLGIAVPRRLRAGQRLFSKGDSTNGVYCVLEGRLAAMDVGEHGDEALQMHLAPVCWFGEMGLYDGLPRVHHVHAEADTLVLWLQDIRLRETLNTSPDYWFHFGRLLTHKLRLALFIMDGRMLRSNELRVARTLVVLKELYHACDTPKPRIVVHQQEVADMLGMSRQTVNQALQRLQADGLVAVSYNRVEITDLQALERKVQYENWPAFTPASAPTSALASVHHAEVG
jgi:CRP-like cAMP-binding protein